MKPEHQERNHERPPRSYNCATHHCGSSNEHDHAWDFLHPGCNSCAMLELCRNRCLRDVHPRQTDADSALEPRPLNATARAASYRGLCGHRAASRRPERTDGLRARLGHHRTTVRLAYERLSEQTSDHVLAGCAASARVLCQKRRPDMRCHVLHDALRRTRHGRLAPHWWGYREGRLFHLRARTWRPRRPRGCFHAGVRRA
jgi:hypothetical protein